MSKEQQYILKGKIIISISVAFILLAIGLYTYKNTSLSTDDYGFAFETFNIQQMATAKVAIKQDKTIKLSATTKESKLEAVELINKNKTEIEEAQNTVTQLSNTTYPTWRLPTEQGYITQYVHYGHIALDITSSRGTNEIIYPVADGVISGIFYDSAGAKIVTVRHYINNQYYTSEYVHLSWYAADIYVGKEVTTNTALGGMGATGIATGVHLHLTVLDCNLFDPNDANCSNIGSFYSYGRTRLSQGFAGLGNLMNVPYSWYSR